ATSRIDMSRVRQHKPDTLTACSSHGSCRPGVRPWITSLHNDHQPREEVIPPGSLKRPLLERYSPVAQGESGSFGLVLQRDFHRGRAQRQWAVLRPPGKHDAAVRHDLQILAPNYLVFVDVNAADATGPRIEGSANAQPAHQFLWLS